MGELVSLIRLIKYAAIFLILAFSFFGGGYYLNRVLGLKDDNEYEKKIEEIVKTQTGLDVDLTPSNDL